MYRLFTMKHAENNWLVTSAGVVRGGDPIQLVYTNGEAHHTMVSLKFAFHPIYNDNDMFYAQHTAGKTGYLSDMFKTLKRDGTFNENSIALIRISL